jgi:hypothetical protein
MKQVNFNQVLDSVAEYIGEPKSVFEALGRARSISSFVDRVEDELQSTVDEEV